MPLLKKGTQTLERKALKTRLNIAGDVVQGINIKQAATSRLKSTGENLFQKAMDTVGSPGQRVLKGPAKREKTRCRQTKQRNISNDISDKNGTCTSQLMRMHEIRTGFIWSSIYTDQCGLWVLGAERIDIEFAVSGAGEDYIDLANTYPFVEAQIMDDDDTALDDGADVGSVNLWMHSLFSDVSVSLNKNLVSPPTSLYPYIAYIEILLSYGPAAKESQWTGVMWYKDRPGHQDKRTTDSKGFTSRKTLTAQSKSVQMMEKVHFYFVKRNIYWVTSIWKSNYDEVETCSP